MNHFIVVREEAPGKFTAYPAGLPELTVTADSHPLAVSAARHEFIQWVKLGKLVPVNVAVEFPPFAAPDYLNDESYKEFVAELAKNRQLEDEEFGIWKVEPGDEDARRQVIETIRHRKEHLQGTIWDYDIPCPDSSSIPTTSPTIATAMLGSTPESTTSPPTVSP